MNTKKTKIMIIDDEPCIRESLTWHLEDLGYEVIAFDAPFNCNVYNGAACTKRVSCTDILLIDQHLPRMIGLDFIVELIERGCKRITENVLLMSGDTTSIDLVKAKFLGITVVQKPMSFEYLEEWLSSVKISD